MSIINKYTLSGLVAVLSAAGLWVLSHGEVIVLHPLAELPVEKEMNQPIDARIVVATVGIDDEVRVLACEDIKTDVYVRVQLADGIAGFIHDARFELSRQSGLMANIRQLDFVTFSCRGWFLHKNR